MTVELTSPYTSRANEYQGQLHCHSTNSDGADTPVAIVTAYRDAGYDFVCLTDHNILTADPGVAGILFIPGVEEGLATGARARHMGNINASQAHYPGVAEGQDMVDAILADGAIPIVNHPDFIPQNWTDSQLIATVGYTAIEIYNAYVAENAETKWDFLLSKGVRVYGIAGDDCHNIAAAAQFDKAWVQVFADSLTVANIVAELKAGNFYSSTGPDMAISVVKDTITITTSGASTIAFVGSGGAHLQSTAATLSASYVVEQCDVYVRVKITRDADSKVAWSNPIWIVESSIGKTSSPWLSKCDKVVGI